MRDAAGRAGRPVAILQDLPGPKLRIGALRDDTAELKAGDCVTFVCGNGSPPGDARRMSIAWDGLAHAIDPGEILYLADGSVRLRAIAVRAGDGEIDAEVEVGGTVASRQGLNIPGPLDILPAVPEEDLEHLRAGQQIGVDLVALSFVRRPEDVLFVREHTRTPLIAKIEKPQARRARRGDPQGLRLRDGRARRPRRRDADRGGADDPEAPARAGRARMARPSITATQMLDSMVTSVAPDARRGRRRRQRDPRRHRRRDALPGDRGRRPPGRWPSRSWPRSRARPSARRPTSAGTRCACAATSATPPTRVAHSACVAARELSLDALVIPTLSGPLGAPGLAPTAPTCRSTRSRRAARPCAAAG